MLAYKMETGNVEDNIIRKNPENIIAKRMIKR
jgi:hypothetical protein